MFNNMPLKIKLREIIFGTETSLGRGFDIALIIAILLSVMAVLIESVPSVGEEYSAMFRNFEWVITIVFTLEYLLRIYIAYDRKRYVMGFWGIVDLLSVLPAYISLIVSGYHYLTLVRILRLLRIFRILKMIRFIREIEVLLVALRNSARKILVFLACVFLLAIILGTAMYVAENHTNGFTSIPQCIYWAIVTITTVGYGDIVPLTNAGKVIASVIMLVGYSIIAVPTGVISVEFARTMATLHKCSACKKAVSGDDIFCRHCGQKQ